MNDECVSLEDLLTEQMAKWVNRPIDGKCLQCGVGLYDKATQCGECHEVAEDLKRRRSKAMSAVKRTVPARYHWARFDAPELTSRVHDADAVAKMKANYLTADRIVLIGPAGVGKTVLACCAEFALAEAGKAGHFVDVYRLAAARAESRLGEMPAEIEDAIEAPFCVVDDLGSEKNLTTSAVAEVIHARHAAMSPTIVTTGFDVAEIRTRYGDGVARRVFEGAVVIRMKAKGVGK